MKSKHSEIYGPTNKVATRDFDCVTTCFFIDTGRNVLDYLETIWNCLKPGGIWINFGPLLYHYASEELNLSSSSEDDFSIELTYDELKSAITNMGFEFLRDTTIENSTYTSDPKSLMQTVFRCLFFTVKKPLKTK